jgi:hypothetical protein
VSLAASPKLAVDRLAAALRAAAARCVQLIARRSHVRICGPQLQDPEPVIDMNHRGPPIAGD